MRREVNAYYSIIEPIMMTASRIEAVANRLFFHPLGTNISNLKILHIVCHKPGISPKEILFLFGGTKSNLSQRLGVLEKKKLIIIKKNINGDKRKISIKLTSQGTEKLKAIKVRINEIKADLESNFSSQEIDRHFAFFIKLNYLLDKKEGK